MSSRLIAPQARCSVPLLWSHPPNLMDPRPGISVDLEPAAHGAAFDAFMDATLASYKVGVCVCVESYRSRCMGHCDAWAVQAVQWTWSLLHTGRPSTPFHGRVDGKSKGVRTITCTNFECCGLHVPVCGL